MKETTIALLLLSAMATHGKTKCPLGVTKDYGDVKVVVNYDLSKVGSYELEDPLTFLDGRKVETMQDWAERRALDDACKVGDGGKEILPFGKGFHAVPMSCLY